MAMEHKAFAFDWSQYETDLHTLLVEALTSGDTAKLEAFIDRHLGELTDPYEGEPLSEDWRTTLGNRDVHNFGDYALTRFYDPTDDRGIGCEWARLSEDLPQKAGNAMLGFAVGPAENSFDPGRMGSYFQTPAQVQESLQMLQHHSCPALARYLELLEGCVAEQRGLYVTF
jgi:hypothetical protein